MCQWKGKIPTETFNKLKPFFSGMSLGDISILVDHIDNDTFQEMKEWASITKCMRFKVFFDITQNILKEYMEGRAYG